MSIQIKGIGCSLPHRVLNNKDLEKLVETSDEWITERTGIKERRIADFPLKNSDLCYEASRKALNKAGISPEEIDMIIVCTSTPDMLFPSTACILQEKLQAWNAAAFDLEAGCTGFIYGINVAEKLILSSAYKNVLVVGVDLCSRVVDYSDRNTCVLFGDGAGAAVLGPGSDDFGICYSYLGADGRGGNHLSMPAGGSNFPANTANVPVKQYFLQMNGREVFKFASQVVDSVGKRLLDKTGLKIEDIDLFVPHQANLRIIKNAIKRCNIPIEKTIINVHKYGNMSAGCIPVALTEAEEEGRLKKGDMVLSIAFGAGLTYGGFLMRWGCDNFVS